MKKQIECFGALQMGKVFAFYFAIVAFMCLPFVVSASLVNPKGFLFKLFLILLLPVVGFMAGVIIAFLYNFIAKWIGGIEIDLIDSQDKHETKSEEV